MIGGPVIRQHLVEFISGTGIVTDGVTDAASTSGPWTWVVPNGVAQVSMSMCGAGTSGSAGAYQAGALSAGGGAGGKAGSVIFDLLAAVVPGASLTVTLGAGAAGNASGDGSNSLGGNTSVVGLRPGLFVVGTTVTAKSSDGGSYAGTAPTSATTAIATRGQGQASDGIDGAVNGVGVDLNAAGIIAGSNAITSYAAQGGGGKASAAVGGSGGSGPQGYNAMVSFYPSWTSTSAGTSSGGGSWGGGGRGAPSVFNGASPAGGNGDAIGTDAGAADYGAGGGGGGGSGTARRRGGNGGNGYVRFTYWSAD